MIKPHAPLNIYPDLLDRLKNRADSDFARLCGMNLRIDMARGIPSPSQLLLSQPLLESTFTNGYSSEDGTDCRNYGLQQGILEARQLFAPLLGVPAEQVVVNGNSSLALMYDCMAQAWHKGVPDGDRPWSKVEGGVALICAVPGYDRHFAMCEAFGIRMHSVAMLEDGPDVEAIKKLVAIDPSIKGMWCVPKYSNPTGTVYSDSVVQTLASMPTAAKDFRLFWDNAYMVHPVCETDQPLADIVAACTSSGHRNRPLVFASTSKMTLPGAGIAMLAGSRENIAWWLAAAAIRSVGPDKVNQMRQVRFLKDLDTIRVLMSQHGRLLKPKFDRVHEVFTAILGEYGFARWSRPTGGYFISLEVLPGIASQVVLLAAKAGITFATPGSCFPYGSDPDDAQLRIAPSFPDLEQLTLALEVIATCVVKASCDHLASHNNRSPGSSS